jgi:hypothetical protein
MNETKVTGVSLEELSATAEWRSLGPSLKRLLVLALQTRNLPAVIHETYPTLDAELQRKIAADIVTMPAVKQLIDLYAVGVAVPLPVATPDKDPVTLSADVPVVDSVVVFDAATVN